MLRGPFFVDTV